MRSAVAACVLMLLVPHALAFEPFVVRDIRVEGIRRIEAGTVFSYLPIRVGDKVTDQLAREAIRALYATGFFRDVRVEREGDVLVVTVDERPAISSIEFKGMKEFQADQVKGGLRDAGLAEGRTYDKALVDQAEQEIKRQYLTRGKYGVKIRTTITPLERNRVAIVFDIDEGDVAKIRRINIVGNRDFTESQLLGQLTLQTPGLLTWYTKNDQYSRQKLQADLETLRSFYQNRGYLDFSVDSAQVSVSPDKRDVFITIAITEGSKYTVSSVKLAGDFVVPEADLMKLVQLKPGDPFSRERLNASSKAIVDRLGNDGYAFANANAVPEVNKDKRTVTFTIMIDPGRRAYVRRISIVGNTRTRDEVARRELRQLEGSFYDNQKLHRSKQRMELTGFFSEVDVQSEPVPGTNDQVDITTRVKEKPTGSILAGIGYSTADRVVLQASISQQNLFGSGNALTLQASRGSLNKVYALSYTNPYYTVNGVSLGYDIYDRTYDPHSLAVQNYTSYTKGAGVRLGYPVSETDRINFGLSIENTRLTLYSDSPLLYENYVNQFGVSSYALIASAGWARDGRDSAVWPTTGTLRRIGVESTVPTFDVKYYKLGYQQTTYFSVTSKITLKLGGELGYGNGYGGEPLPFFKAYTAGGIGSVRGYYTNSLGPQDANGFPIGGSRKLLASGEVLFPMPGLGQDRTVRLGTFVDAGQVWNPDYQGGSLSELHLRYSTGILFSWVSPIGPLALSMGYPLARRPGDRIQHFQFQLGTTF